MYVQCYAVPMLVANSHSDEEDTPAASGLTFRRIFKFQQPAHHISIACGHSPSVYGAFTFESSPPSLVCAARAARVTANAPLGLPFPR